MSELQSQFTEFKTLMTQQMSWQATTIENQATLIATLEDTIASLLIQQNVQRSEIDDLAANTYTKVDADATFPTQTDVQDLEDEIDALVAATYSKSESDARYALKPTTAPTPSPTPSPTNSPSPSPTPSPTVSPTAPIVPLTDLATVDDLAWIEQQLPEGKTIGTRLYKASIDGDALSDFHAACDNKGMTLFLVETTDGYRFGAFAGTPWTSVPGYKGPAAGEPRPFLFGLPGGGRSEPYRLDLKAGSEGGAYYHKSTYGPTFGTGHDLIISGGCLSSTNNNYTNGNYKYEQPAAGRWDLAGGTSNSSSYFQCADWEVYQIV